MKKSRTTMKAPASSTGRAAQVVGEMRFEFMRARLPLAAQ
jgi:hypothetical protein